MAAGTIVKAWKSGDRAHLAVSVTETQVIGGVSQQINVEYIGSVDAAELEGKTAAQQRALLAAAAKASRERSIPIETPLSMTGNVTI